MAVQLAASLAGVGLEADMAALASVDSVGLRTFGVTYAAVAALYIGRKNLSVAKADMIGDGMSQASVASMETGFLVMYAFGQLCLGALAEAAGPRRGLTVCFALAALALTCFTIIESDLARIALWSLNGLLQAMCYPLCIKALSPHLPAETRGQLLGLWTTSLAIGGVTANMVAAAAMANFGWRAAFSPGPAALLAAVALLVALCLPGERVENLRRSVSTESQMKSSSPRASVSKKLCKPSFNRPTRSCSPARKSDAGPWTVLTSTPGLLSLGCSYFMLKLARYVMLFWMPLYLHQHLGYSSAAAATVATLFDVGAFAGSVLSGFLADKVQRSEHVVLGMCLISALMCLLLAHAPDSMVAPLMLFAGVAISGPDALLTGLCTQQCVERAKNLECLTTAVSVVNGLGSLGAMLQGCLVTYMLEASGLGWPGVWGGCMLLCLSAAALVDPRLHTAATRALAPLSSVQNGTISVVAKLAATTGFVEWLTIGQRIRLYR